VGGVPVPAAPVGEVEAISIDMSGRTEFSIGDVVGFFQIVDAA
jgi:hypothetical protein